MKLKIFLTLALVILAVTALAQYSTSSRGLANNDYIAPATTNTYYSTCEEFEHLPLTISLKASGASSSFVPVVAYRSLNSTVYETTPYYVKWLQLSGTTLTNTTINLPVEGAAVLQILVGNTNASSPGLTNTIVVRPKAMKEAVFPTSR